MSLCAIELVYLIVGGGGFLGAKLIEWLQNHGFTGRIRVLDPNPRTFSTIQMDMERVEYIRESFRDNNVLDRVLNGVTAVFHLASIGHHGLVAGDREAVFDFNVNGTIRLMEACLNHGVSRFLYASSVAVNFVGIPITNASEDDPLPATEQYLDNYSASKAEAERHVLLASTEAFKTVCLRFRGIYGAEDPIVTDKVARMIKGGLFIVKISAHQGRESWSNGSSGVNCAKAFALADNMLQVPNGLHGRAYFIVDGETTGQYQFWSPLVTELGSTEPSITIPYEPLRVLVPIYEKACYSCGIAPLLTAFELAILANDNTYNTDRARNELGYEPEPSSMDEVVEYYRHLREAAPPEATDSWRTVISSTCVIALLLFSFLLLFWNAVWPVIGK